MPNNREWDSTRQEYIEEMREAWEIERQKELHYCKSCDKKNFWQDMYCSRDCYNGYSHNRKTIEELHENEIQINVAIKYFRIPKKKIDDFVEVCDDLEQTYY